MTRSPVDADYNNVQPRLRLCLRIDTQRRRFVPVYGIYYTLSRGTIKGHTGFRLSDELTRSSFSRDGNLDAFMRRFEIRIRMG